MIKKVGREKDAEAKIQYNLRRKSFAEVWISRWEADMADISSKVRLVVSDVDGTLVGADCVMGEGIRQLAQLLSEQHIAFTLASGRPVGMLEEYKKALNITRSGGPRRREIYLGRASSGRCGETHSGGGGPYGACCLPDR